MAEVGVKQGKTDWLVPAALLVGGAGVAAGIYFYMKKPPGVDPGDRIKAHFSFVFRGDGGSYILLVRFGYHRISDWFDPEEGLDRYTAPVNLPGPGSYEFDVVCILPDGTPARVYDAEGSVLSPSMQPGQEWLIRVFKDKAITVR